MTECTMSTKRGLTIALLSIFPYFVSFLCLFHSRDWFPRQVSCIFCGKLSATSSGKTEGDTDRLNHQLLNITVPQSEANLLCPAFVEVQLTSLCIYLLTNNYMHQNDVSSLYFYLSQVSGLPTLRIL